MSEELQEVIDSNPEWYKNLQYKDVKIFIKDNINSAARSFVATGYYLKYVRDNQLYKEDGYESIWDFAKAEYGIGKSSASQFMSINDKFSKDGNSPILLEQYKDFTSSKLAEMLTMTEEQLGQVTPATTIVEIRQIKKLEEEETVLTSEQKAEEEQPSGKCIHRPEFPCTLSEASKIARGDGVNCNAKCCWNCEKREGCGYECNSSALRPEEVKQKIQCFDRLAAYWCKRNMTVELYELAKSSADEDIKVFDLYFKEKYTLGECFAPSYDTPGYEIPFGTNKDGVHFYDEDKTEYSWMTLIELIYQEARGETPASKPGNVHENSDGLKRLKEIRKEIRAKNAADETVIEASESVIEETESVSSFAQGDEDTDPVETVTADIIQTVPEPPKPEYSPQYFLREQSSRLDEMLKVGNMPELPLQRQKTLVCALAAMVCDLDNAKPEPVKPAQPELPILKNNDQRAEWLRHYSEWGVWYQDDNINARYYKYDFQDGSRIVVVEHMHKQYVSTGKYEDTWGSGQYHLIGGKDKYSSYVHEFFSPYPDNTSELIEHLKNVQKKK